MTLAAAEIVYTAMSPNCTYFVRSTENLHVAGPDGGTSAVIPIGAGGDDEDDVDLCTGTVVMAEATRGRRRWKSLAPRKAAVMAD